MSNTNAPNESKPARGRSRQSRSQDTLDKVLRAALKVFSTVGYERASTREIAREAGLEQGHLAYYFKRKVDLWRAVVTTYNEDCIRILEQADNIDWSADCSRPAESLLRAFLLFMADNPDLTRMMLQEFSASSERRSWVVEQFGRPAWARLSPVFEALSRDGRLGGASPEVAYFTMLGGALVAFGSTPEIEDISGRGADRSVPAAACVDHLLISVLSRAKTDAAF